VWPRGVVVGIDEQTFVEKLVAHPAIERLDVGYLEGGQVARARSSASQTSLGERKTIAASSWLKAPPGNAARFFIPVAVR
jgi:hypothetical protein